MKLKNIVTFKREVIPKDDCPIDFITNFGSEATKYVFVLSKVCASDIVFGRMPKKFERFSNGDIQILWSETDDVVKLKEIDQTHQYAISYMKMNGIEYIFNFVEPNVIYLDR